jgi:hypothetical protein
LLADARSVDASPLAARALSSLRSMNGSLTRCELTPPISAWLG